ncbi:MAG: lytic murein transglycosylase B, partial [Thioalkalispiraceae bacterium]
AVVLNVQASTRPLDVSNKNIQDFIKQMNKQHQFDAGNLTDLLKHAHHHESIIEAISRPAESKPWYEYRPIFLTRDRLQGGVRFWGKNANSLSRAKITYGVPEEIITAIIGVETRYGKHKGRFPVLDALATLAFAYPPRSKFFTRELEHYLLMTREENIDPLEQLGSYAGAMGMPQFISSSFRRYAVDFDGDGKRDLWNNPDDAIGSVANYFKKHQWKAGQPIASKVRVHGKRYKKLLENGLKPDFTKQQLMDNGVILPDGLPDNLNGTLIELETKNGPEYWVGWHNFYVISRYNHSALYSMAVFQLSEQIRKNYR